MIFWGGKADIMLYPVKNDDWQKQITRRPPLQSRLCHLTFTKNLLLYLFYESKEIWGGLLLLPKKRQEVEIEFSICLALSRYRALCTGAVRVAPPSSFPRNCAQPWAAIALNCVCERLCFISIYFVHLLARGVLRYQKSLKEVTFGGLVMLKKISI